MEDTKYQGRKEHVRLRFQVSAEDVDSEDVAVSAGLKPNEKSIILNRSKSKENRKVAGG